MNDYKSIWQKYSKSKNELTLEEYEKLQLEIAFLKKQLSTQSKLIKQLKEDANEDSLTKLWNRRKFQNDIEKLIEYNRRYCRSAGILFIDLNDFKSINDTLGHLAGDFALKHVAEILKKSCRVNDEVYRLGGDEFIVIIPEIKPLDIYKKSNLFEQTINNTPCIYNNKELKISVSIGVSLIDGTKTKDAIIEDADKNMYKIKQNINAGVLVS
jgi:diguanylate cyclase (GGDEF)-like protein